MARVLKAKYFSYWFFMEAYKGATPSITWKSLIEGREIMKNGLAWKVGNKRKIDIRKITGL